MARTYSNLWHSVTRWENLLLAYQKCRRRKRFKSVATEFDFRWEDELIRLRNELEHDTYQPGPYRHFHIQEPKPRKISAAPFRDRVVHHAIVNVIEPLFERRFIHDSYACRRGKGTHAAIDRAQTYLRRFDWFLKTDIVRFFPNVDHELLFATLSRTIRDARLSRLIRAVIDSGVGVLQNEASSHYFPGDDLFSVTRPRGLPIGNLTSQFFANVFLDPVDHAIKEEFRVAGYVRYADDLVLFGDSKQQMWEFQHALSQSLAECRLKLHPNKTHVQPCRRGVPFLGFHVQRHRKRLLQSSLRRFSRRARRLRWQRKTGDINYADIRRSLESWIAHAQNADADALIRSVLRGKRF